jgi:POT family proton-dependent oligopeptide transporter
MATTAYRTTPTKSTGMPPGIPYIVGNEAAERFSFYGMNSILVTFMTKYMVDRIGAADHMTEPQANEWYHTFMTVSYLFRIGAILADVSGKIRRSLSHCLLP